MLRFHKYLLVVACLFFFSCQNEIDEQNYNDQTVTNASPLTSYLQRVAMVKTVQDNIIDGSSYCTIKLPYTVTVNNETIAINTTTDYQKVIDNINAYTTDEDIVRISFPVTMVYYNYIEKLIPNQSDFDTLIDYWNLHPDLLSKINGLNIQYPISINIYNSYNQQASSVTITSDQAFFDFIKNLNASQYISLRYPVSIKDYNNQTKSITNNLEFENAIKYAIDNCSENNIVSLDFAETITKGSWKIAYFFKDSDKTSSYTGYEFAFKNDKTVVATKDGISTTGQWDYNVVNGAKAFKIYFNYSFLLLHKLDYSWVLFEFNNSVIHFRDEGNGNYLYFEKIN